MPKKSKLQPAKDISPPPPDHDLSFKPIDSEITSVLKKNDHGTTLQQRYNTNITPETLLDEDLVREESHSPPPRPSSLLSQLPHGFPSTRKSQPLNIRDGLTPSEKVSDQEYTPPSDTWLNEGTYSKSPQAPSISSLGLGHTPPLDPGFSKRQSLTTRTPPVSPPQRNVRPLSFGGSVPPVPALPQFPTSSYGSPPAPHLPQQHFYAAQDVDLGLPRHSHQVPTDAFSLARFVRLPSNDSETRQGFMLASNSHLEIFTYDGARSSLVGSLDVHDGTIVDACFLSWTSGTDPLQGLRPLLAVTSFGKDQAVDDVAANEPVTAHAAGWQFRTRVDVYSLATGEFVAELLQTPVTQFQPAFPGLPPPSPGPTGCLKLIPAGNFFAIASGVSGEVFVFGLDHQDDLPGFSCITKLWTNVQPQSTRRDSVHQRASDVDYSPADLRRGRPSDEVPIIAASGRWLAICPANRPSRQTFGFTLGLNVLVRRNAAVELSSAPSRPVINCDVESPDADTLLGKMARGVAQEVVKGAKWLGDQGMQAWQNYWRKDSPASLESRAPLTPQQYSVPGAYGVFPPTHGDTSQVSKEPEIVSIFDLKLLNIGDTKKASSTMPFATFQPPRGCSFLSFAPNGLSLLTASRKGDFQYVWDLLQVRYPRTTHLPAGTEASRLQPRVRQVARYERLSGTTIVDVAWESPNAHRFAVLTKNKTVHLFDLPANALRWPPPRLAKSARPISAPPDGSQHDSYDPAPAGGFFASAMNFAGQTQPILASLRGRAPSAGSGLAGIGSTGIGLASATGARGSKAVATGLSKSLGAATDTVSRLQQAYESRKHLKHTKEAVSGRLMWLRRGDKVGICILEDSEARFFQIHKTRPRDQRLRTDSTVFDARKSVNCKLSTSNSGATEAFWKLNAPPRITSKTMSHPLSFAEIETNAPYQPFHSDRRVTISVYTSATVYQTSLTGAPLVPGNKAGTQVKRVQSDQWVFGDEIPSTKLQLNHLQISEDDADSVIYRETTMSGPFRENDGEQIVSTTRRKKQKRTAAVGTTSSRSEEREHQTVADQEGFFEDDCDVLDFATDRV